MGVKPGGDDGATLHTGVGFDQVSGLSEFHCRELPDSRRLQRLGTERSVHFELTGLSKWPDHLRRIRFRCRIGGIQPIQILSNS